LTLTPPSKFGEHFQIGQIGQIGQKFTFFYFFDAIAESPNLATPENIA